MFEDLPTMALFANTITIRIAMEAPCGLFVRVANPTFKLFDLPKP